MCHRLLHRLIEDVTDLQRPVVAGTEQVQGSDTRQWTHFMLHGCSTVEEETLDHLQRRRAQWLEEAKPKALSNRRVDPIKGGVGSGVLHPPGTAVGEETTSRFRELSARVPLRSLQTSRQSKVGKQHRGYSCSPKSSD
ncbi:MAG: hypothetical protein ACJ73N_08605 [Bryobacteraceae bacterium]